LRSTDGRWSLGIRGNVRAPGQNENGCRGHPFLEVGKEKLKKLAPVRQALMKK
jgi:hypothetical protein